MVTPRKSIFANISCNEDHDFLKKVRTIIDRSGVTTHRLKFELTESYFLQDLEKINVGKALSLNIIAEGVETEQQREFLIREGCDMLQGYFFARPMAFEKFEKLLFQDLQPQETSIDRFEISEDVSHNSLDQVEAGLVPANSRLH